MVEVETTLSELYSMCRKNQALEIGDGRIGASSMRQALQGNFKNLLDMDQDRTIVISTAYDPNPGSKYVFLGNVVHMGHDDYGPAWIVKKT